MRHFSAVTITLILAACAGSQGPEGSAPAVKTSAPDAAPVAVEARGGEELGRCNGLGFVAFVGRPLVRAGDPLPDSGGYLHVKDLPAPHRVLAPGAPMTMDYRPDRLNVEVTKDGIVRRLYCG